MECHLKTSLEALRDRHQNDDSECVRVVEAIFKEHVASDFSLPAAIELEMCCKLANVLLHLGREGNAGCVLSALDVHACRSLSRGTRVSNTILHNVTAVFTSFACGKVAEERAKTVVGPLQKRAKTE